MGNATKNATAPITDAMATCWTCDPLEAYANIASDFSTKLATELQAPMERFFITLAALWIVTTGYKILFLKTDFSKFGGNLVYVIIASILLGTQGVSLIETVFNETLDLMTSAATVAFKVAEGKVTPSKYTGLAGLAYSGEVAIAQVFYIAGNIITSSGLFAVVNIVYAVIIIAPYLLMMIAYSAQVTVAIFRLMMLAIFAPFLFMSFAFDWGQGMAKTSIKTLIAAVLVLFASTVAFALTIYAVNIIKIEQYAKLGGKDLNAFASIENPQFLVILFMGWAGLALMAEGTSLANSIAGSSLTNVAAGIMTAGMAASGAAAIGATRLPRAKDAINARLDKGADYLGGKTMSGAGKALGGAGRALGGAGGSAINSAQDMVDRIRTANTPQSMYHPRSQNYNPQL